MAKRKYRGGPLARDADWIMIRVRRETHARLRTVGARMKASYERGCSVPAPNERQDAVALDIIIQKLLDDYIAKQERSRRPKRRKGTAAASTAQDGPTPGPEVKIWQALISVYTDESGSTHPASGGTEADRKTP